MSPSSFWSTEHVYPHSWDQVSTFYWSRYPNPFSSHVFSEDLIECSVDPESGLLRTKRLIVKTNKLPWWGKHLFSAKKVAVIEETTVDPKARLMTTYTRNIGLTIFMGTTEKNFYRDSTDHEDSQKKTVCQKNVWITSDIVGLRSAIRKFGVDRFKSNCVRASDGLLWAIKRNQLNSLRDEKQSDSSVIAGHVKGDSNSALHVKSSQIPTTAKFMAGSSNLAN